MMAELHPYQRLGKALLCVTAVLTALALWLLLSFITPGTWRFIETRGWGEFLLGYGFMAGPGILALILAAVYLRRPAVPPMWLHFIVGAGMVFTFFVAFQFAMY